ncbi:MAG: glutathione S-transferase family protein [Rhizobacter sp.]|nr:glutathione S-transferase family protein [Bacteriovorax sp.]
MKNNNSIPTITAFKSSPDRGRGLARDFRVRWALEEVGQSYNVQLETFEELKKPPYLALQPFGQIPAYKENDLVLFESGAIIFHIAEKHSGLLPAEENARARAIAWMFCALNTVEMPVVEFSTFFFFEKDKSWYNDRLPLAEERIHSMLKKLSTQLGSSDWLEGDFSAGDLLMVTVLRRLESSGVLKSYQNICGYIFRAEARPAYQRAFAAQLAV